MYAPDKATEIKGAIALVVATLTALWGGLGWAVLIWIFCMLMDYASGTWAAKRAGEWSSDIARDGLWHKRGEVLAVLVVGACDVTLYVLKSMIELPIGIDFGAIVTPVVLFWYIITELGSIIENAGRLGAPVPVWLQKSLKDYKRKLDADQGITEVDSEPVYIGKHDREHETAPDNKNEDSENDNADIKNEKHDIKNEKQTE